MALRGMAGVGQRVLGSGRMADLAMSMKFTLPSAKPAEKARNIVGWEQISGRLAKGMDNPGSLQEAVMSFQKLRDSGRVARTGQFEPVGLLKAITQFQQAYSQTGKPLDFYGAVLPKIAEWAMEMPTLFESEGSQLPLLHLGRSSQVVLSRAQARCLMAHMFFGTLTPLRCQIDPEVMVADYPPAIIFGEPFFDRVYISERRVAVERIICQLAYFTVNAESFPEPPAGNVRFSRLHSEIDGLPDWGGMEGIPIPRAVVSSSEKIEDSPASTHVDFANKHLHIGQIIPSVTQEELLFSLRPELFIGLLISPTMMDREAIYMDGALWYNTYSGYMDSFAFTGFTDEIKEVIRDPSKGGETSCVVAIDAIVAGSNQFRQDLVDRDLGKAWLGFNGPRETCPDSKANPVEGDPNTSIVSTGNWGCGIFGGDHFLKFLQQAMAAAACGKTLHYSTFGSEVLGREIAAISQKMTERGETVASVYRFLTTKASSSRSPGEFREHLANWLGVSVNDAKDPNQCCVM